MLGALEVKRVTRWAAQRGAEWKMIHTAVISCLLAHCNRQTGHCWPARKAIAAYCHVSERTVDRAIVKLIEWGAIKKQQPRGVSTGHFGSRQYVFLFELPAAKPGDKKGGHRETKRGVTVRQNGGRNKEEGKDLKQGKVLEQAQPFPGQVHEIAALYPKIDDAFRLTLEVSEAISTAIRRDGRDAVWAGTKSMAEKVAHWPRSELRFLPSPQRYFHESQYRKDPEFWERSGNGKPSRAEQNLKDALDARTAARRAVGLDH